MLNARKIFLSVVAIVLVAVAMAQEVGSSNSAKEGFMRSEGKIYVVAAVVITILAGLILYVARLDRKITKLEKDDSSKD